MVSERDKILNEINRLRDKYKLSVNYCKLCCDENSIGFYASPLLLSYRVYEIKSDGKIVHYYTTKDEVIALKQLLRLMQGKAGIFEEMKPEPELINRWELLPGGEHIKNKKT